MREQIFISYRREGGDVTAKLICESLKNHGYTVFYDYDSLSGGFFDNRIIEAIEGCTDFILVLPKNSLDRCDNPDDWVRMEIECALKNRKNIIPVTLPDFVFPTELPDSIKDVTRVNAVPFFMAYFEGVIGTVIDRLFSKSDRVVLPTAEQEPSANLEFIFNEDMNGYAVKIGQCKDSVIVVPRTYKGKMVCAVAEGGFRDYSALSRIVLPDSIVKIEDSAFNGCSLLEEINLPEKLTDIGGWALYKCESLTRIVIPKNVKTIGKRAFARCTSVRSFVVDPTNAYFCNIGNHLYSKGGKNLVAFACASNETVFRAPDCLERISDCAFAQCASLVSIVLPESAKYIYDFAFIDCTALEEITMPTRVHHFGDLMFKNCSALREIVIPQGATSVGEDSFRNCSELRSVAIPDTVTSIGECAFNGCVKLSRVNIPEQVTDIGRWAFYNCKSLKSIFLGRNVSSIGMRAFTDCMALPKFVVDPQNSFFCTIGNHLFSKDQKTMISFAVGCGETNYTVPNGVERIEDSCFSCCSGLKRVVLPESVDYIGKFAFVDCTGLTEVVLPKRATTMEPFVFKRCSALTAVAIPQGVTELGEDMFRECTALKRVSLPSTLTSIGKCALYECPALESLEIPDKVTEIGAWAIYGCNKLTKIKIPKNVKSIGNRALAECAALESISVSMFNRYYCAYGKNLYTKDMRRLVQYAIGRKDKHFDMPPTVVVIGDCAFSKCETVESMTIPKTVTSIEDYAFDKCTKLKQVAFGGTRDMWRKITLGKSALRKWGAKSVRCTDGVVNL